MTRLYFDTNVYRFIRAAKEIPQVTRLLAARDCVLTASSGNLFETYAISSPEERREELRVLVSVADEYEYRPESWSHALELRREIKRLRPQWLRAATGSKRRSREFLKGHQERWKEALRGAPLDVDAYAVFRRDFEDGVDRSRHTQQQLRQELRKERSDFTLRTPHGESLALELGDPEVHWRTDCLQVWYNAIELRSPASRDYADWLEPYLRPACFRHSSYTSFWLTDVSSDALPLNRLTGLIAYYQLQKKITHGNPADQLHASHWWSSDLFVTADRAFHEILTEVAIRHYPNRPRPVLIDRSATSVSAELERIL